MKPFSLAVLGAGSFGTALAHILAQKNLSVTLWGRSLDVITHIQNQKTNPDYLDGIDLAGFKVTPDLAEALYHKDLLIFAVPAQALREFLESVKPKLDSHQLLVNTAKGIENESLMTPSQIFCDVLGYKAGDRFAALSGPTFAIELAKGHPSGAVIASRSRPTAKQAQKLLSTSFLRLYTSSDVLGVELGGALKNVMAIATGIAEGLEFGLNTRAGLITRCLHDMIKLGIRMGANPLTFSGLSGMGDLVLTCTGELSRNRKVGFRLGQGESLETILKNHRSVVEGIPSTQAALRLAEKFEVDMPNVRYVYKILYESMPPQQALKEILSRELKDEMYPF